MTNAVWTNIIMFFFCFCVCVRIYWKSTHNFAKLLHEWFIILYVCDFVWQVFRFTLLLLLLQRWKCWNWWITWTQLENACEHTHKPKLKQQPPSTVLTMRLPWRHCALNVVLASTGSARQHCQGPKPHRTSAKRNPPCWRVSVSFHRTPRRLPPRLSQKPTNDDLCMAFKYNFYRTREHAGCFEVATGCCMLLVGWAAGQQHIEWLRTAHNLNFIV